MTAVDVDKMMERLAREAVEAESLASTRHPAVVEPAVVRVVAALDRAGLRAVLEAAGKVTRPASSGTLHYRNVAELGNALTTLSKETNNDE